MQKLDCGLKIRINDPLSYVTQEFQKEIKELLRSLMLMGEVSISCTGKQDIKSPTCGDVSLYELVEIHERQSSSWTGAMKISSEKNGNGVSYNKDIINK
jgi:hypothetical protein